jgi:hypothetical protein
LGTAASAAPGELAPFDTLAAPFAAAGATLPVAPTGRTVSGTTGGGLLRPDPGAGQGSDEKRDHAAARCCPRAADARLLRPRYELLTSNHDGGLPCGWARWDDRGRRAWERGRTRGPSHLANQPDNCCMHTESDLPGADR